MQRKNSSLLFFDFFVPFQSKLSKIGFEHCRRCLPLQFGDAELVRRPPMAGDGAA
jgi:hypothetical protein